MGKPKEAMKVNSKGRIAINALSCPIKVLLASFVRNF